MSTEISLSRYDYEYPRSSDLQIAAGYLELARIERARNELLEDPATAAFGAPIGDFMEDYDRKEINVLARISRRAQAVGDIAARQFCLDAFEKWMP
jgi:hypothetical protein